MAAVGVVYMFLSSINRLSEWYLHACDTENGTSPVYLTTIGLGLYDCTKKMQERYFDTRKSSGFVGWCSHYLPIPGEFNDLKGLGKPEFHRFHEVVCRITRRKRIQNYIIYIVFEHHIIQHDIPL
jgi:hypothetical protein